MQTVRATTDTERRKLAARVMMGKAFSVKTPPSELYMKRLSTWLTTGSQGALVYGRPRLGKTSASRWVLNSLSEVVGRVPWIEVPIRDQPVAREREFFQHVLRCARHKHYMKGSSGDKRDRLAEWLAMRAIRSPVNMAVLFIDEAHLLNDSHYQWLTNIGNELDGRGCRLFSLLVGQPELLDKKRDFIDRGKEQFVGRFMIRTMEFRGLKSLEELSKCLAHFDGTKYPARGGVLFTEHFLPLAVHNGFKLSDLAPGIWSAFERAWINSGLEGTPVIAMHYFTAALMSILVTCSRIDSCSLKVPEESINRAVFNSGYIESIQSQLMTA